MRSSECVEMCKSLFSSILECDTACKKSCSGAGPEQCVECASGYRREEPEAENEPEQDGEQPALPCLGEMSSLW